jgi:hypothetical protein
MFSGSYDPDDVTFLLKPVQLEPTEVAEKEHLIQSRRLHYSEMISRERLSSPQYLSVFQQALAQEKTRFARDLLILSRHIVSVRPGPATIVSLARAGTPIGVLIGRTVRRLLGRPARHYSVSIIRDRGLDEVALRHILRYHAADSVIFVDGWTGKGVIANELRRALTCFNAHHGVQLDPGLYTVADLCGAAAFAASAEDYLIPSSVLGATVSGLISRSILNDTVVGPGDFHGCLYYEEFLEADQSRWFVDQVFDEIVRQVDLPAMRAQGNSQEDRLRRQQDSAAFLADILRRFDVGSVDYIKPGLGEATRVLLRRVPKCVLVRDPSLREVAHLVLLAREKNVPVLVEAGLPYRAAAIIKELER